MWTRQSMDRIVGLWLLGLFMLATVSGSSPPDGDLPVKVTFTNQFGSPVVLFRVGPQGETSAGVVKAGNKAIVNISIGQNLIIRGGDNKLLGRYASFGPGEVSIVISPPALPGTKPAAGPPLSAMEVADLLRFHNRVRQEVGVGPVKWSPELAAFAQAWADELARTGTFRHRSHEPGPWQQKYGENIAFFQGEGAETVVVKAAEIWYAEKKDYTPGTPIPADFSTLKAGHYTQMVWRETTEIGAAKATIRTGDLKGAMVIVSNYKPPGNMIGKTPY